MAEVKKVSLEDLGMAFKDVPKHQIDEAIRHMTCLANGERDAVAVTLLLRLDIDVPFKAPLFSDTVANDLYWPQVKTWAARQLGLETKEKRCEACGAHAGFTYDKISKVVTCNACGALRTT